MVNDTEAAKQTVCLGVAGKHAVSGSTARTEAFAREVDSLGGLWGTMDTGRRWTRSSWKRNNIKDWKPRW